MTTHVRFCILLALVFAGAKLSAQGSLQFNQVLLLTAQTGQQTVPAGKVWKLTSERQSGGYRYGNHANNLNVTWSATNPNPCTGATSGTVSVRYLGKVLCGTSQNGILVNGTPLRGNQEGALWFPAGTTILVSETPCINTLSPNIPAGTPYYVLDQTNPSGNTGYYECDGPLNLGSVPNTPLYTIIEFNIVP